MYNYRAHERARPQLMLLGQIARAERNGNEQQTEQGRPCRSYQKVKVMPFLQHFDRPHKRPPTLLLSNMSAVAWVPEKSAIFVMAEIPRSSSYGGIMCQVLGNSVPSGKILQ